MKFAFVFRMNSEVTYVEDIAKIVGERNNVMYDIKGIPYKMVTLTR